MPFKKILIGGNIKMTKVNTNSNKICKIETE